MRLCAALVILLAGAVLGLSATSGAAAEQVAPEPIAHLIAQLGSNQFRQREAASQALEAVGAPALTPLKQASANNDLEVRRRARTLVRKIEQRLETERLLAPHHVHLVYKDMPVNQAVLDFCRKTGFNLQLGGNPNTLAGRKITLDTGDTTLWDAFDQFCQKAGLAEPGPGRRKHPIHRLATAEQARRRLLQQQRVMMMGNGHIYHYSPNQPVFGQMVLVDGKAAPVPTYQAGAVRIRALSGDRLSAAAARAEREKVFALEVLPEPRVHWQGVVTVRIDKAVDDRDQSLIQTVETSGLQANVYYTKAAVYNNPYGMPVMNTGQWPVQLQAGTRPSKMLREVHGTITAQMMTPPEPFLMVKDVLKANAPKEAKGNDGTTLRLVEVEHKDGKIKIRVQMLLTQQMRAATGGLFAGRQTRLGATSGLSLQDAQGKALSLVSTNYVSMGWNGWGTTEEAILTYQPAKGQGEALQFVFTAPREVVVQVPFTLKDVPLP